MSRTLIINSLRVLQPDDLSDRHLALETSHQRFGVPPDGPHPDIGNPRVVLTPAVHARSVSCMETRSYEAFERGAYRILFRAPEQAFGGGIEQERIRPPSSTTMIASVAILGNGRKSLPGLRHRVVRSNYRTDASANNASRVPRKNLASVRQVHMIAGPISCSKGSYVQGQSDEAFPNADPEDVTRRCGATAAIGTRTQAECLRRHDRLSRSDVRARRWWRCRPEST